MASEAAAENVGGGVGRRRVVAGSLKNTKMLEEMITEGEDKAYEALQLFRSRCNRMKTKGDVFDAIEVAATGVCSLLAHGYESAGKELAMYIVEDLVYDLEHDAKFIASLDKDSGIDSYVEMLTPQLRTILNGIDAAFSPRSPGRVEFMHHCVRWSMKCGARLYGDPLLHSKYATLLWDSEPAKKSSAVLGGLLTPGPPAAHAAPGVNANHRKSIQHFAAGEAPKLLWQKVASCLWLVASSIL